MFLLQYVKYFLKTQIALAWQKAVSSDTMKKVSADRANCGGESTLKVFYGKIIE